MPKLKSIILHIGPDKTGSTAIQRTLAGNAELLESCGVLYSSGSGHNDKELAMTFSKVIRSHISRNSGRKPKRDHGYLENLQQRVKSSSADHLILSHEGLIHLTVEELWALQEFLKGLSERVAVVLYARDPFSYALSAVSQRVLTGRRAWGYSLPIVEYKDHIERWSGVFGREALEVRLFSREVFPDGDVVLDFISMQALKGALNSLDASRLKSQFDVNPGFSGLAIRVGDRIIEILGNETPIGRNFKNLFFDALYQLNSGKAELTPTQKKLIRGFSRRHTEYLAREFNIAFPEFKEPVKQSTPFLEKDVETLARKIIASKLPEFRLGYARSGWRRLKCWAFDHTFIRGVC
tara:strand:- start:33723 stop:34775 length:1053 start_codon:yes stop_codon:yes gene_type:complete